MTGTEKLKRITEIQDHAKKSMGLKYWEADEIMELRKDLKVSDLFLFLNDDECSVDKFYRYFPDESQSREGRKNSKLDAAVAAGYVKYCDYTSHGRIHFMIRLTAKGRKLIEKARGQGSC